MLREMRLANGLIFWAKILGVLISLVSIQTALSWSSLHLDNTFINWCTVFSTIIICLYVATIKKIFLKRNFILCSLFLCWAVWGAIRGIPQLNNYWITKNYLYGVMCVSLPCLPYVFSMPDITQQILKYWNKLVVPLFLFCFIWFSSREAVHFYLGPIYFLYAIFWSWLPKKWKFITAIVIIYMIAAAIGARSQVIKGIICIMFAIATTLYNYIPSLLLKVGTWSMYIAATVLLILGLTGTYNIFDHKDPFASSRPMVYNNGEFVKPAVQDENLVDTRTFIYVEVISSALMHDYVITGRSLARGNDSLSFGKKSLTGEMERYANELCHTNIFTWLGIIGVILYSAIYIQASWLALYRSRNKFVKFASSLIAFHWLYGWVENQNRFDSLNIALWMIIAMCLSSQFRTMTDKEIKLWFLSIFDKNDISLYKKYSILKLYISMKLIRK